MTSDLSVTNESNQELIEKMVQRAKKTLAITKLADEFKDFLIDSVEEGHDEIFEVFSDDFKFMNAALETFSEMKDPDCTKWQGRSGNIYKDETAEEHMVERDGESNLKFYGHLIGSANSRTNDGHSSIRWTVLALYKTQNGKYVCEQAGHSRMQGERKKSRACVCDTHEEVISFFGHEWLAKELYEECEIDASETVG